MKKTNVLVGFFKTHYVFFFCLRFVILLINGHSKVQRKIPNLSHWGGPLIWTVFTDILAEMI